MIKLILLDIDGVMTDGRKYYDKEGTVRLKTFAIKTGLQSSDFVR